LFNANRDPTSHDQIRLRCVTQPDAAQATLLDRSRLAKAPRRTRAIGPRSQRLIVNNSTKNVLTTFRLSL
jgi:hypothetical protein